MDKLEKVTKGLERCIEKQDTVANKTHGFNCTACPYFRKCDSSGYLIGLPLMRDALALLKAQEPVSVQKKHMEMVGLQTWDWACGNCGQTVLFSANFCPWCGRAVKWE